MWRTEVAAPVIKMSHGQPQAQAWAQARADRGDRCGAAAADEHGGDLSFPKGTKGYTPTRNQRSSWKRSALPPERATCVRPETHTHSQGRVTSNVLGSLGR